ncbi:MerR family transcriptional regulator [Nonomuraea dietziae]|uniref:MerR family transcriptional regulator n=1 Tax=Nonomuraea dietziae TaxID=65515 RepID=UPI0034087104
MSVERLDDLDYPAYTTGQAAQVLGVQQAFLRGLDSAGAVRPDRSAGGHRRYSRRQLLFVTRIRELFDQGHSLASALRILSLEDQLAVARAHIGRLQDLARGLEAAASEAVASDAAEDHPRGS